MNIHTKLISLFTLMVAIFFIQTSFTSALTTCPGRPATTLSWSSTDCTAWTPVGSGSCTFGGPSGSQSIPNGTSCSVSFSCTGPGGSAGPVSDSLNYDPSLVWNGSSCVTPAPTCPADTYPTATDPATIANYCGACPAGYHQPSSLACHSGNTPGWTAFGSSCTAPYCTGCGCIVDAPAPINGSCSATHYSCNAGTSGSNVNGATAYTWSCTGSNGGTTASCSEAKPATGSWSYTSACPTSCGQPQTTQTQVCTGGNGSCSGSPASRTCYATAACAPNTNCVGSWSDNGTCSVSGACGQTGVVQQTYTITTPQSGTGTSCPYTNGATRWGSTSCSTATCPVAVNGSCSSTHYSCTQGTSGSAVNGATAYTWSCAGSNGGTTDYCSEAKPATGSLSVSPSSCVISGGASTCTVTASWSTTNASSPSLVDGNTGGTLSTAANSSGMTVWVTNPSTVFNLRNGGTTLDSSTVTASCASGSTWNGSSCAFNPCTNGANNAPTCNTCSAPQVWNGSSSSCNGPLGVTVNPASYSATLPTNTISATYTLTSGNSSNSVCKLLDNTGSPLTSYASCTGSMSVTAPASAGTYGYFVQAYKSQTGETMVSNGFTVTVTGVYGCMAPGANNRNPAATVDDGSCCYGWDTWNGSVCVTPSTQITTFITEPRISTLGIASTLSWDIKYPTNSCTLTATAVCTGGHSSCTASQLASESALNQTFQTGNTDSNDVYGASRSILSAIRTVASPSTTNARGKKTLQINTTTDLLLDCGGVSKKIRFLTTTNNEG